MERRSFRVQNVVSPESEAELGFHSGKSGEP